MLTKRKTIFFTAFVVALALFICGYFILGNQQNGQAKIRVIRLEQQTIADSAIFNEFEDAEFKVNDSTAEFVGYKLLDPCVFDELDNLSVEEKDEMAAECRVRYNFTYDSVNNVVKITAEMKNEYGEIFMDTLEGAAFYNEKGELDAVMNIEGEGILLSEMCDSGMIENCGWFSRLIKCVAIAVAVAAAVVTVAAIVVVTCGAAAPAFVAAGVGAMCAYGCNRSRSRTGNGAYSHDCYGCSNCGRCVGTVLPQHGRDYYME